MKTRYTQREIDRNEKKELDRIDVEWIEWIRWCELWIMRDEEDIERRNR